MHDLISKLREEVFKPSDDSMAKKQAFYDTNKELIQQIRGAATKGRLLQNCLSEALEAVEEVEEVEKTLREAKDEVSAEALSDWLKQQGIDAAHFNGDLYLGLQDCFTIGLKIDIDPVALKDLLKELSQSPEHYIEHR